MGKSISGSDVYVLIMAGGSGTRLWPYSRVVRPKQFLDLLGTGKTLLQHTYDRMLSFVPSSQVMIVSHERYETWIKEQLPDLKEENILLEPHGRNTAPCIAYAAAKIHARAPHARMIVAPADHIIQGEDDFKDCIHLALEACQDGDRLITLGIKPSRPDTGYGYIQFLDDSPLTNQKGKSGDLKSVKTFAEKPSPELAKEFLSSGDFLWNAGIFVWKTDAILRAFQKHLPDLYDVFEEGKDLFYQEGEHAFIQKAYALIRSISVDYGILEKHAEVFVVRSEFGWSDLGSWNALYNLQKKDEDENVFLGCEAITYESRGNFVRCQAHKLVILDGMEDYFIGDFGDVLILCKRSEEARFRSYVSDAREKGGDKWV
ncbi:MAG: mannose-1-phosphate guanylyltransferase [Cytophagales bacterium]|nr:mannose-1-phosphate guanylyltransferase [Cytophagales bacterium]